MNAQTQTGPSTVSSIIISATLEAGKYFVPEEIRSWAKGIATSPRSERYTIDLTEIIRGDAKKRAIKAATYPPVITAAVLLMCLNFLIHARFVPSTTGTSRPIRFPASVPLPRPPEKIIQTPAAVTKKENCLFFHFFTHHQVTADTCEKGGKAQHYKDVCRYSHLD
jgi:hypothetical protein